MIYMDNAATTMHKPQEVIDAVVNAMNSMGNAGRGASEAACKTDCIYFEFDRESEYCNKGKPESGRSCDHNCFGT